MRNDCFNLFIVIIFFFYKLYISYQLFLFSRIDFDDGLVPHQVSLESDNNSDIVFDDAKMVPEGKDFKIVFISSESKSGSELNSSLECELNPEQDETLNNVKGEQFISIKYRKSEIKKKSVKGLLTSFSLPPPLQKK